jgi:ClpP class serine protease
MHSTFKRSQIASLIKDTKKKPTSIIKTDPKDEESKGDFLIVPLKGEFGTDIYPLGVINAMDWCVKNKVPQIVFVIDSPGGYVWAAEYMAEKMAEKDAALKFTMVIDSAISASIWPAFASDRWFVTPAAIFGGAVVYSVSDTGARFSPPRSAPWPNPTATARHSPAR